MSANTAVTDITRALDDLARDLAALEAAGRGIPAVEKNTVRMRGTLNALRIQFEDLAALESEAP